MKLGNRNKKTFWYALFTESENIYKTDDNDNVKFIEIDGEQVPLIKETRVEGYSHVTEFRANISAKGNADTDTMSFGVDDSLYQAQMVVAKGLLPIDETSLIWLARPLVDSNGNADPKTADYKVVAKNTLGINYDYFALQAIVKNG